MTKPKDPKYYKCDAPDCQGNKHLGSCRCHLDKPREPRQLSIFELVAEQKKNKRKAK
jgi:hypothetical protein